MPSSDFQPVTNRASLSLNRSVVLLELVDKHLNRSNLSNPMPVEVIGKLSIGRVSAPYTVVVTAPKEGACTPPQLEFSPFPLQLVRGIATLDRLKVVHGTGKGSGVCSVQFRAGIGGDWVHSVPFKFMFNDGTYPLISLRISILITV